MPQRTWGGSGGSSSRSSSSSPRSSGSSGSSGSYRSSYSGGDDGSSEPVDPTVSFVILGVIVVVVLCIFLSNAAREAQERQANNDATATTRAITHADLEMMHNALDSKIPHWRETATTNPTRVGAEAAGFGSKTNTKEVVYGFCDDTRTQFYVYVLNISKPKGTFADTEGYAYTSESTPRSCHPPFWNVVDYVYADEAGWYFAIISTDAATRRAYTATPTP